jgi:hypothetical protein
MQLTISRYRDIIELDNPDIGKCIIRRMILKGEDLMFKRMLIQYAIESGCFSENEKGIIMKVDGREYFKVIEGFSDFSGILKFV